ncbi:M96 mating-specific protein family [Phytophthora cinnamomi]|uniref:M96 mating-specific protein family n=1 Tax=Phytophthora cinnamomi TaxID=4785 RepID=UPI003559E14D|nr:M96 mating-specific protein family [Phytophthora cinnamomi]
MASELEEVLAWLDESPEVSLGVQQRQMPSPGDTWEPLIHWGISDVITGDFGVPTIQESGTCQTQGISTKQQNTKKRKKVNPNRARDERRFQLIELQEEVAKLEFTSTRLRNIKSSRRSRIGQSHQRNEDAPGVPKVWQDICSRQVKRRLATEWENVQLKQQYEIEKQLVTSVAKVLFKRWRPDGTKSEPEKKTRRTDVPAGHVERMTAMIFEELLAGVKACYRNVDRVFRTSGTDAACVVTHGALLDGGMTTNGSERTFVDKRTVPFDMQATGAAWWENWHNYRDQRSKDVSLNEFIERFGLEMNDFKTNTSATAYCQQVSHRYVEESRIVFVWDAYIELYGFKNERISSVYFLEQMYVLVEPDEEGIGDMEGFSTRMSIFYAITPHFLEPNLKDDAKTDAAL